MASVRQQINIAATPRAVWRALTTEEGLTSWWVDAARVDAREGGRITLTSEGDDGEPVDEVGIFLIVRPTRKIEIAWDKQSPAETRGSRVQFAMGRDGKDIRVAVIHSGRTELFEDEESFKALDKSWKSALKALRSALED